MAPRIGDMTAIATSATVVIVANRAVATPGARPAAATEEKNSGNTAVMTVDQNAELAQSYIAHARTSRRSRPSLLRSDIGTRMSRAGFCHEPRSLRRTPP